MSLVSPSSSMATMLESVGLKISCATSNTSGPSSASRSSAWRTDTPCLLKNRFVFPRCHGLRLLHAVGSRKGGPMGRRRSSGNGTIVCEKPQDTLVSGEVTSKTWKELVLESDIPVMVDFWAPWCGPCRMIAPLFDELAVQYAGRVRCFKLNTDESPTIATDYGIRSIPTVMIFKDGQKKDTVIGAVPKATLNSAIEKFLDR